MCKIIDLSIISGNLAKEVPVPPKELQRRFMIVAKAFSLNLISTDATMNDVYAAVASMTPQAISDIAEKIVIKEALTDVKYTI